MKQFVMIIKKGLGFQNVLVSLAINHGEEKPKSYPRSSFEEEPEKQLGLLRSFVFVQNIVVEAKPLFLHRFFPNTKTVREEKGGTH